MMSPENTKILIALAKAGDADALQQVVMNNMGLVRSLVTRFRDRGVEYDDLMQLGTMGMIKAIRSFDESYGTTFSTYAVPLILGEIRRFLRDDGAVKVGRGIRKQGIDAMRNREKFIAEHGREPRLSELAQLCEIPEDELASALDAVRPVTSLSECIGAEEEGITLESLIADPENRVEAMTDSIALREAIRRLPSMQRQILYLRYDKELSQQKTGEILHMTQVKVSREEKKILQFLRNAMGT